MADPTKAFISYSRGDGDFVLRLCQDLRAAGASIWVDSFDIRPGDEWDDAIARGLDECGRLLVVLSPRSVASANVLDEVGYALSKEKLIIPVLYEDCEVPYRLNRLHYVDFRTSYDGGLRELLSAIRSTKRRPNDLPAPGPRDKRRRWYLLAGAAAVPAALVLTWAVIDQRPASVDPATRGRAPAEDRDTKSAVPQGPSKAAAELKTPKSPPAAVPSQSTQSPKPENSVTLPKASFRDSYRKSLLLYLSEAPSGFKKLGAQEFVDWTPSVKLPAATGCRGSGYPSQPVIQCVLYRTDSEIEAARRFEDLIEITGAVLADWERHRLNMYVANFSNDKVASLVHLNVYKRGDQFDVLVSVRPKR